MTGMHTVINVNLVNNAVLRHQPKAIILSDPLANCTKKTRQFLVIIFLHNFECNGLVFIVFEVQVGNSSLKKPPRVKAVPVGLLRVLIQAAVSQHGIPTFWVASALLLGQARNVFKGLLRGTYLHIKIKLCRMTTI
jgi:hypothetical protein